MPDTTQPQLDPLAGKNYRIRRLLIKMDLDVYDDDGFLTERGTTDEVLIAEAQFPAGLTALLASATRMGRGFAARPTPRPRLVDPGPAEVAIERPTVHLTGE